MKGMAVRQQFRSGSLRASAARALLGFLAMLLLPALAAAASGAAPANPRLASMQIEIWPEYDRPSALVILKGELPADAALPASISLRLPASSGGPLAVAYSAPGSDRLLNLKYEREDSKDFVTLRLSLPDRVFHVEFYDPLETGTPQRSYSYVWPGDLAAARFNVIVQEPAASSEFSVQPNLDAMATGQNGLRFRSSELGAIEAKKQVPIKVRYTKTDTRTSSEIVQPKGTESPPLPAKSSPEREGIPDWALAVVALILAAVTGAALLWRRIRSPKAPADTTGFCTQCGAKPAPGDRFCAKCGVQLG